jgi:predicted NUDIX family NTP pyrophosphohydrolase
MRRIGGFAVKTAAGCLLYRRNSAGDLEVLLVHPSGNYNRHKPWSIPKGLLDEGEDEETAARRETWEEAGIQPGTLVRLGEITYTKSRKRVVCFAGEAADAQPRCNSWEVDKAEFLPIEKAREFIHPDQREFLEKLLEMLIT